NHQVGAEIAFPFLCAVFLGDLFHAADIEGGLGAVFVGVGSDVAAALGVVVEGDLGIALFKVVGLIEGSVGDLPSATVPDHVAVGIVLEGGIARLGLRMGATATAPIVAVAA